MQRGCSRATIYRAFPGGKDAVADAVVRSELSRLFQGLARRIEGIDELEDLLVAVMSEAVHRLASHATLQFLLANEPEIVFPYIAFGEFDHVLAVAADFLAPRLQRWLDDEEARRAGEWLTRITMSYLLSPPDGDIDAQLRHVVHDFVMPGIKTLQAA